MMKFNICKVLVFTICSLIIFKKVDGGSVSMRKVSIRCYDVKINAFWCCGTNLSHCSNTDLIVDTPDTIVEKIIDENGANIQDTNSIDGLWIYDTRMKFIPKGINKFLPNLKGLWLERAGLLSLEKQDMEQFGENLKFLHIKNNKLMSLASDVFDFNPNLVFIYVAINPIRYFGKGILKNLHSLTELTYTNCLDSKIHNIKDISNFDNVHGCNDGSILINNTTSFEISIYDKKKIEIAERLINSIKEVFPCITEEEIEIPTTTIDLRIFTTFSCESLEENSIECETRVDNDQTLIELVKFSTGENLILNETKVLYVKDSLMMYLPENLDEKFENLEKFSVTSSGLLKIERKSLNMKRLKKLKLISNILTQIPNDAFLDLIELEELNLSKNKILSLSSKAIKPLRNLKILNVENNLIQKLSIKLMDLGIAAVSFRNNKCINVRYPSMNLTEIKNLIKTNCNN